MMNSTESAGRHRTPTLDTRWYKVAGDLWGNKTRTLLVALSIAVGVLCVGMVTGARQIILTGLNSEYDASHQASAALTTVGPFGPSLLHQIQRMPDVGAAEGRYSVHARFEVSRGEWQDLVLFAIPNYHAMRMDTVLPDQGAWPPPTKGLLLERSTLAVRGLHIGDRVEVEMPNGTTRVVRIAGTTHDITQPATSVLGTNYGYVTMSTLGWMGGPPAFNQLYVAVKGDAHNTLHVWRVASSVRTALERTGLQVSALVVPQPGRLWVYDAVQSMLVLLGVLGICSLLMSGLLVVNTVSAQITQQTRQIGIMKAIGISRGQLAGMYLVTVLAMCLLALVAGIPLGVVGALGLIGYSTHVLNFDTPGFALTPLVLAFEVLAGIGIPLLAALVPIAAASRITVREAIASQGQSTGKLSVLDSDSGRGWLVALPRPMIISLANVVRRKGRLALTLVALSLGGAVFIAVLTVRASLVQTLDDVLSYRNFDVQMTLDRPYNAAAIDRIAAQTPGVAAIQGWGEATAQRVGAVGAASEDVPLVAPPARSSFIKPVILDGRWLRPGDRHALVANSDVLVNQPDLRVGRHVSYVINGRPAGWTVVGIVRGMQEGPILYTSYGALAGISGQTGRIDSLQVVTRNHSAFVESQVARALEVRLKHAGIAIASTETTDDRRASLATNFDSIVIFLLVMAALLALVGGLGLMGTMSLSVLEQTREIGIMRAIGASHRQTLQIVMAEGLVIAVLSWFIGAAAAIPLSPLLSDAVGSNFLHAPLAYTFSWQGTWLWLAGALVIALLASFLPAWRASRLTVRDVLAYE